MAETETVKTLAETIKEQKAFKAVTGMASAPVELTGELKTAYETLLTDAKKIADSTSAIAEKGITTAHGITDIAGLDGVYEANKTLKQSKTIAEAAEAVNLSVTPAADAIAAVTKEIEGLAEGTALSEKQVNALKSTIEKASKNLQPAENGAKASLAKGYQEVAKTILKDKDKVEGAAKTLAEDLKLGDMVGAINEYTGAKGENLLKNGEDVLKHLETGSSKLFGMLRADGFKATINHVYNPLAETTEHVIGNPANSIGTVKRAFNAGVSVAGAGLMGDAIFRAKNSEGEDRSAPGRVVEAAIGLGTLVAPVARAIR